MKIACGCTESGMQHNEIGARRFVGVDDTSGRFADVELQRCARCGRLWLRYFVEYEGFSRSGRWAMAEIDDATAATMTPEAAADFVDSAPAAVVGGSFWNSAGKKAKGPFSWGFGGR